MALLILLVPSLGLAKKKTITVVKPVLDEVVSGKVYRYNVGLENGAPGWCGQLIRERTLCRNAAPPTVLTPAQLKQVKALLRDRALTGDLPQGTEPCWNPHQGFELQDARNRRLVQVDVSLECSRIEFPMRTGPALTPRGAEAWRALLEELKRAK